MRFWDLRPSFLDDCALGENVVSHAATSQSKILKRARDKTVKRSFVSITETICDGLSLVHRRSCTRVQVWFSNEVPNICAIIIVSRQASCV